MELTRLEVGVPHLNRGAWLGITEPPGAFRRNYGKLRRFGVSFVITKKSLRTSEVSLQSIFFGRARNCLLSCLLAPTRLLLCPPLPRPALPRHSRPGLRDGLRCLLRLADHVVKHLVDYVNFRLLLAARRVVVVALRVTGES